MTQDISIICPDLIARIYAICWGEEDPIAIMATVSAELFHAVDGYDWVGFYRVVAPDLLKIGPYQGGHGCLAITFDRGVAARLHGNGRSSLLMMLINWISCYVNFLKMRLLNFPCRVF